MPNNAIPMVAGAIAGVALTPVLAPVALGWLGFSALGPVAGSFVALIQSGIGNVVAGSAFATAQSVAMGGAVPTVVTAIGAGVGSLIGAQVGGGGDDDEADGDVPVAGGESNEADGDVAGGESNEADGDVAGGESNGSDGDSGDRSPPSAENSRFLVVVHPYPLNANLGLPADRRALALWLACCVGKDALRAMFYRPSFQEMVVIEVNGETDSFLELIREHVWSEFLVEPTKEEMGKSSMVLFSSFDPSRQVKDGWKRVKIEEHWFTGWPENNSTIKHPYPPLAPSDLGPRLTSQSRDWNEKVGQVTPERIDSSPARTSPPSHSSHSAPASRVFEWDEKDQLRYPTVDAAVTNLFEDDYLMSVSSSWRNKKAATPSGNAPTSPGRSTRQPVQSAASPSPNADSHTTWSSISRPTVASPNTNQRSGAPETRSSVSPPSTSSSLSSYDPVTPWRARVAGAGERSGTGAEGLQKLSKNARKKRDKAAKAARARAQATLDDESSWGDPDAMSWGEPDSVVVT